VLVTPSAITVCNGVEIISVRIEPRHISQNAAETKIDLVSSKVYRYNPKKKIITILISGTAFNDYRDSTNTRNSFLCTKHGLAVTTSVTRYVRATSGRFDNWQPFQKLTILTTRAKLRIDATWRLISGEEAGDVELHDTQEDDRSKTFPVTIHRIIH
jgi:hypothetical protein